MALGSTVRVTRRNPPMMNRPVALVLGAALPARAGRRLGCHLTTALACAIAFGLRGARAEAQSNVYIEPSASLVNQTVTVAPGQFAAYKLSLTQRSALVP